jgi:hypothetical protein
MCKAQLTCMLSKTLFLLTAAKPQSVATKAPSVRRTPVMGAVLTADALPLVGYVRCVASSHIRMNAPQVLIFGVRGCVAGLAASVAKQGENAHQFH